MLERNLRRQSTAPVLIVTASPCNAKVLDTTHESAPALGMFEVFGRTGPPILGGRQFWHPLFSVTYRTPLGSLGYSALQSPDPRKTHKFT